MNCNDMKFKKYIFNEIELILNYDFGVLDKWLKKIVRV